MNLAELAGHLFRAILDGLNDIPEYVLGDFCGGRKTCCAIPSKFKNSEESVQILYFLQPVGCSKSCLNANTEALRQTILQKQN